TLAATFSPNGEWRNSRLALDQWRELPYSDRGAQRHRTVSPQTNEPRFQPGLFLMWCCWSRVEAHKSRQPTSPLVADLPQQLVTPGDVFRSFDALWQTTVNHPHHTLSLFTPCHDDFNGVGGGAKDRANFGHVPDGAQDIDGISVLNHQHKRVTRSERL